jgi:hypothetical protein
MVRACGAIAFAAPAPSPLMGNGRGGGEFAARCPKVLPPARSPPRNPPPRGGGYLNRPWRWPGSRRTRFAVEPHHASSAERPRTRQRRRVRACRPGSQPIVAMQSEGSGRPHQCLTRGTDPWSRKHAAASASAVPRRRAKSLTGARNQLFLDLPGERPISPRMRAVAFCPPGSMAGTTGSMADKK